MKDIYKYVRKEQTSNEYNLNKLKARGLLKYW